MDFSCIERPLRSIESDVAAYIALYNRTGRTIDLYWFDYDGKAVLYRRSIANGSGLSLNTFHGHPYQARDQHTHEVMHMCNQAVLWPMPWNAGRHQQTGLLSPEERRLQRRIVNVHFPMRTLRETALWHVVRELKTVERCRQLVLPPTLRTDIEAALEVFGRRRLNGGLTVSMPRLDSYPSERSDLDI